MTATETMIIGLAGGTGSGKTTLSAGIVKRFGADVCVLYHDNYYLPHSELTLEQRSSLNYDHPDAFETALMIGQLRQLRLGRAIDCPSYDFKQHTRSAETIHIEPCPVIIVEGIMVFENADLRELMDIKIFVDTAADVRIIRRILRDVKERGRSLDSVINQYITTVKPMHEQFVEPSKKYADIIIPEGGHNMVAQEIILGRIADHLSHY
ncbi:MAG: uridine kinase [Clostridia bacterium]|nr:uridine kinase [Clostridia bacterium]